MQIFTSATYLGVQFPARLSPAFLAAFPHAKWNSQHSYWELDQSEKLQLEQWQELVYYVATEIALAEKLVLIDQRVIDVKSEISFLHELYGATWKKSRAAGNSKEVLEEVLDALDAAKEERMRADAYLAAKRLQVETLLWCVVDVDAIRKAADIIATHRDSDNPVQRRSFEEAKKVLLDAQCKLKKVRLRWEPLQQLVAEDIDEVLCDLPMHITEIDWLTVTKLDANFSDSMYP